jgi:UDP-N-acetylmuramoyl-tripeptide--D-alanyl-D-alanine ligase
MHFSREFIKKVIPEALFYGSEFPEEVLFSIDSRTFNKGEIFVALKGSRVDGHEFIPDVVTKGAAGLFVDQHHIEKAEQLRREGLAIAVVPDTRKALLALASAWRAQFSYPVIGITGSVGKTTTKEMLAHAMRVAGKRCLASHSNQNTALGSALNILKMRPDYDVAIFEMGINKRGEMARMAEMIRPTTAIITAIGHSHMEGLGSINDIAAEKRDIFKYFKSDSVGIINGDQPLLATIAYTHPIIKFGYKMTNQIQARKIQTQGCQTHFMLKLYRNRYRITMPTNHSGPVLSGLAVAAASYVLGINAELIIQALQYPVFVQGRFERRSIKNKKGILIDDCYNASPESMKAALLAFEKLEEKGQKIAVLGDMLELGVNAPFWHRQLGRFLRKVPSLNHVVLVGESIKWAQKTMPPYITCDVAPTWKEAVACLTSKLDRESVVLIKGSNSLGLTNIVQEMAE